MPYRDFTLPDGVTVRTRISDEATLEWYYHLPEVEGKGYPDRPPDVDTATMRMWCGPAVIADRMESENVSSLPIGVYVLNLGENKPTLKLMIGCMSPGDGYHIRLKMESGLEATLGQTLEDLDKFFPYGQEDAANEFIDANLKTLNDLEQVASYLKFGGGDSEWLITTPGDLVRDQELWDEAITDYHQEYGEKGERDPYVQAYQRRRETDARTSSNVGH